MEDNTISSPKRKGRRRRIVSNVWTAIVMSCFYSGFITLMIAAMSSKMGEQFAQWERVERDSMHLSPDTMHATSNSWYGNSDVVCSEEDTIHVDTFESAGVVADDSLAITQEAGRTDDTGVGFFAAFAAGVFIFIPIWL